MDLFQAIEERRSVRQFSQQRVPAQTIRKALDLATLAPNSSNLQTWDFYWIHSEEYKKKLQICCLSQSAAMTASDFVVVTASPDKWHRSWKPLVSFLKKSQVPASTLAYYEKTIPFVHRQNLFFLWARALIVFLMGFFRPIPRNIMDRRGAEEVAIKSAALAAENFVLAMTAQGYATCMMEGFDERRVQNELKLSRKTRIAMIIAVGEPQSETHLWPRFRLNSSEVIHEL